MSSSYLKISVLFSILCLVNSEGFEWPTTSSYDVRGQSTKKHSRSINSVIDSLINAIHPVEETHNPVDTNPINTLWNLEKGQDIEEPKDPIAVENDSDGLSPLVNSQVVDDNEYDYELPSEFYEQFDAEELDEDGSNKFIIPLIQSLLRDPDDNSLFNIRKPSRRPRLPHIRFKPKLNITNLLRSRTTTQPAWILSNAKNEQASSTPRINDKFKKIESFHKTKQPVAFISTSTMRPLYGPYNFQTDLEKVSATIGPVNQTGSKVEYKKKSSSRPTLPSTSDDNFDEDLINLVEINIDDSSESPSQVTEFDMNDMLSKINLLMNLKSNSTEKTPIQVLNIKERSYADKQADDKFGFEQNSIGTSSIEDFNEETTSNDNILASTNEEGFINDEPGFKLDLADLVETGKILKLNKLSDNFKSKTQRSSTKIPEFLQESKENNKMVEDYEPVKLDLPAQLDPNLHPSISQVKPDFDLDTIIGKLNSMIASTTTTTPENQWVEEKYDPIGEPGVRSPKLSTRKSQPGRLLTKTPPFGPILLDRPVTPIIGPLHNSIGPTIASVLGNLPESTGVTAKKRRFPWAVNPKRDLTSTTPLTSGDQDTIPDFKVNNLGLYSGMTTRGQPVFEIIPESVSMKPMIPALNLGKIPRPTPKLPNWLSNIFSSILPKTTPKGSESREVTKDFDFKNNEITQAPIEIENQDQINSYYPQNIQLSQGKQGNYVGSNSGQSWNGVGTNNGQGGIIIGSNSGNGKKPSRIPAFNISPLASYNFKPTLVAE